MTPLRPLIALAIVVVKDDSVVFIKGYGVRELGKPDPVTVLRFVDGGSYRRAK